MFGNKGFRTFPEFGYVKLNLFTADINFNFTTGFRNGLMISVPMLPNYS